MKNLILALFILSSLSAFSQSKDRFSDDDTTKTTIDPDFIPQRSAITPAQSEDRLIDKLRFGGFANAGFSTFSSFVMLSPRVFYLVTPKLWTGAGVTFIYFNNKLIQAPYNEQVVYGLNFTAMYQLIQTPVGNLFTQIEYEPLNFSRVVQVGFNEFVKERVWAHGMFVGGGLMQSTGRGGIFITVLYNLNFVDGDRSYYSSPWVFRVGLAF